MPYVISGSVIFKGYVWVDGQIVQEFDFTAQNVPSAYGDIFLDAFTVSSD